MTRHDGSGERERQAHRVLDDVRRQGPGAIEEETLRVQSELVRLYGWEGYQRVMTQMESDLAQLNER